MPATPQPQRSCHFCGEPLSAIELQHDCMPIRRRYAELRIKINMEQTAIKRFWDRPLKARARMRYLVGYVG